MTCAINTHFEGAAGAGGGFSDQGDVFPDQGFVRLFGGLQLDGEIDQVLDLRRGVVSSFRKLRFSG
ncbi:MAG: hypothetical protein ACLR9W_13215 [Enterobacter hormaechei]